MQDFVNISANKRKKSPFQVTLFLYVVQYDIFYHSLIYFESIFDKVRTCFRRFMNILNLKKKKTF